ncbi:MAG: hypothetical protein COA79_08800 [Planctomycetota bacterium]|nr:MAG: hypothetical protein COA79_08800 [Planctomycetota bacterium]
MAKKKRTHQTQRKQSTKSATDDTKFYIKFKDPRIKSQIFYYFTDEDIFDPCIPLNDGDIIHDSKLISLETAPPALTVQKPVKKVKIISPKPVTKRKPVPKSKPVLNEETFQVVPEDLLDDSPPYSDDKDDDQLDDSFEDSVETNDNDLAYMTAMDIQIVGSDNDNKQSNQTDDDDEFEVLEEVLESNDKETNTSNSNRFRLDTAFEESKSSSSILNAISLSKEEFDRNTTGNEINIFKEWNKVHLDKNTLIARKVSMPEFRLLKKVVGIKKR